MEVFYFVNPHNKVSATYKLYYLLSVLNVNRKIVVVSIRRFLVLLQVLILARYCYMRR